MSEESLEGKEDDQDQGRVNLTTARLSLRPASTGEIATLATLSADKEITEALVEPSFAIPTDRNTLAIFDSSDGRPVGAMSSGCQRTQTGIWSLSCWIGKSDWGKGFGTEVTHAMIDRLFQKAGTSTILVTNRVTNHRARRLVEKCGFQFRHGGMAPVSAGHGAVPVEIYVLERRNWVALKAWGSGLTDRIASHEHCSAA